MKTTSVKSKPSRKVRPASPGKQVRRVEFTHPTASQVCIAGTFNDWHPTATDMVSLGNGQWVKELTLPPGRYEYRLVVDDQWIADPQATESVPNPYGGTNSVLHVPVI